MFSISFSIFTILVEKFREHLKTEIAAFFETVFLKILDSLNSSYNHILYTLNEERLPLIVTHKHTARVLMKHLLKIRDEEFEDYELPEKKIIMVYLKDDLSYDTHKELDFYNTEKKVMKNK